MKLKMSYLAILTTLSSTAMAGELKDTEYSIQGNISYNYSDFDHDELFDEDLRLQETFVNFSAKNQFMPNLLLMVDVGAGQNNDFVNDDFDNADELDLEINQLAIQGEKDGFIIKAGRMFTPIGYYHHDPLNKENFFNDANQISRFIDGVNVSIDSNKSDIKTSSNFFLGTRADGANLSTVYGGNFKLSDDKLGHINLGFVDFKMEDPVEYSFNSSLQSSKATTINLTYVYESDKLNLAIKGEVNDFDELGNESVLLGKVGYQIDRVMPYVSIKHTDTDLGNDNTLIKKGEVILYTAGMDMDIRENLKLYGEYSYFDGDAKNSVGQIKATENMYRAGLKFEY